MTDDRDDSDEWSARTPVGDFAAVEVRFAAIEKEQRRQHKKIGACESRNILYDKQIATHHEADERRFDRIDEKLGEVEKRDEKREKQDGKIRTAIITGAITLVVTAGTAVGALLKSARGEGDEDATIRALVEKTLKLDTELTEIRTLLWRVVVPVPPAGPAPGVTP